MIICGALIYRFRWSLRLRLYYLNKRFRNRSIRDGYQDIDDEVDGYDLMVSYLADDEGGEWVRDVLTPTVDKTERARLCVDTNDEDAILFEDDEFVLFYEDRDLTPNESLIGPIVDAMQKARKVMLVVTEGYLKDGRCCFEMEQAVFKSCSAGHGVDDVIAVLFDESVGIRELGSLHHRLELRRALHWTPNDENGRHLFWKELRDRLTADRP